MRSVSVLRFILELFLLLPIIVGLIRWKRFLLAERFLLVDLGVAFVFYLISFYPFTIKNLLELQYVYSIVYACILHTFLQAKLGKNDLVKRSLPFWIFTLVIFFTDYNLQEGREIKTMVAEIVNGIVFMVVSLKVLSKYWIASNVPIYKNPTILIIVPIFVFYMYFSPLLLLIHFLYNTQTASFFLSAYLVVNIINFLSYISFTLAFLWLPKKEAFL